MNWPFKKGASNPPPTPTALMGCPFCHLPLSAVQTKEEMHVDPTGNGLYRCENTACNTQPVYRRVDINQPDPVVADDIRAANQETYYKLVEEQNELVKHVRYHHFWKHFLHPGRSLVASIIAMLQYAEDRMPTDALPQTGVEHQPKTTGGSR